MKVLVKAFTITNNPFKLVKPDRRYVVGRGGVTKIESTRQGTVLTIDHKIQLYFTTFETSAMVDLWEWIAGKKI